MEKIKSSQQVKIFALSDNKKIKTYVLTGPESTGKSTLSDMLAKHYSTNYVKEYAREYLEKLSIPYTIADVIKMAEIQHQNEKKASKNLEKIIFLDTDLTVFKVWIKEKYNQEIDWINKEIEQGIDKIYLLCNIDLPWISDPLREHPNISDRKRIFKQYVELMNEYHLNYHIISGDMDTRINQCLDIIDKVNS